MCNISCQTSFKELNNQEMSSSYWTVVKREREKKIQICNFPPQSFVLKCLASEENVEDSQPMLNYEQSKIN